MRSISILHPSYGRPELAAKTARTWIERAGNNIEYLLCITYQDSFKGKYEKLFKDLPVRIIYHPHANMVKQLNYAAQFCKGDIIINVSDDFTCPENWDTLLLNLIGDQTDIVVKTDDGIRVNGINSENIIALPIMDRVYYDRFKYIYHPDYGHFFGDEELSNVGDMLGRKITIPITFEHIHYTMGKAKEDATNVKNNKHFEKDKETFKIRKQNLFGLNLTRQLY